MPRSNYILTRIANSSISVCSACRDDARGQGAGGGRPIVILQKERGERERRIKRSKETGKEKKEIARNKKVREKRKNDE